MHAQGGIGRTRHGQLPQVSCDVWLASTELAGTLQPTPGLFLIQNGESWNPRRRRDVMSASGRRKEPDSNWLPSEAPWLSGIPRGAFAFLTASKSKSGSTLVTSLLASKRACASARRLDGMRRACRASLGGPPIPGPARPRNRHRRPPWPLASRTMSRNGPPPRPAIVGRRAQKSAAGLCSALPDYGVQEDYRAALVAAVRGCL